MTRLLWLLCASVAMAAAPKPEVVWNSIVPATQFTTFPVGWQDNSTWEWAVAFEPDRSCALTSIFLPLAAVAAPAIVAVALAADAHGVPGEIIETFPITKIKGRAPAVHRFRSAGHPPLREHTRYWIVASAPAPGLVLWLNGFNGTTSRATAEAFRQDRSGWSTEVPGYAPGAAVEAAGCAPGLTRIRFSTHGRRPTGAVVCN